MSQLRSFDKLKVNPNWKLILYSIIVPTFSADWLR